MNAIDIANAAANATNAADAGVVVGFLPGEDPEFSIWAVSPNGGISQHRLNAGCTDLARLTVHVEGFIQNHKRSWAKAQSRHVLDGYNVEFQGARPARVGADY